MSTPIRFCARAMALLMFVAALSGCKTAPSSFDVSSLEPESMLSSAASSSSDENSSETLSSDLDSSVESEIRSHASSRAPSVNSKPKDTVSKTSSATAHNTSTNNSHETPSSSSQQEYFPPKITPIDIDRFLYGSTSSVPFQFYVSSNEVIYQFSTAEEFDAWLRSSVDSFPAEWNCDMLQQDGYYYLPQWPASMEAKLEAAGLSTYGQIKLFYKTPKEGTVMVRYMLRPLNLDNGYEVSADHDSAGASFSLDDGYCISTYWELPDRYQLAMSSLSGLSLSEPVSDTCPEAADHITELLSETTWARIGLK